VPRVADRLCVHAMEIAAGNNTHRVEPRVIALAGKRLGLGGTTDGSRDLRRLVAGAVAVAACAVLVGGTWGWMNRSRTDHPVVASSGGSTSSPAGVAAAGVVTTKALETAGGLTVTIAGVRTESRARAVVAQLVDQGFPAFMRSNGEGGTYQVIVGPYVSAEEAVAAQKALAAQGAAGTEVQIETADLNQPAWR